MLSDLLLVCPDENTRLQILEKLWKQDTNLDPGTDSYWDFYARQCGFALHDAGRHISIRTHEDLVTIAQALRNKQSRTQIRDRFRHQLEKTEDDQQNVLLDASIDLAAMVLLMMDFGDLRFGFSGRRSIQWTNGSVDVALRDAFCECLTLTHNPVKLDKMFQAHNLVRMAGLEIIWTDNLVDHLRLTDDDTKIHIFHHATYLHAQCHDANSLLPPGLAKETLNTLALLLPSNDPGTQKWFHKTRKQQRLDISAIRCGYLKTDDRQIERFKYWYDRLVVLKQAFDEAEPRTLKQWWFDRRRGALWFGFWNAIAILVLTLLTLLFGIIQCFLGGMQAWASMQALKQSQIDPAAG